LYIIDFTCALNFAEAQVSLSRSSMGRFAFTCWARIRK